ncbi:MAG: thioredoxin, partial [Gemmatimonadetes bacterium]|nr:thioredoxin [Gemmatimonadota bacterium]
MCPSRRRRWCRAAPGARAPRRRWRRPARPGERAAGAGVPG